MFQLDERGRIVMASHDYDNDGTPDAFDRFVRLLVAHAVEAPDAYP